MARHHLLPGKTPAPDSGHREECCGSPLASELLGVQHDLAQAGATEDCTEEPEGFYDQTVTAAKTITWTVAGDDHTEAEPCAARLGELLLPGGLETSGGGSGWLGTAKTRPDPVAAIQAHVNAGAQPEAFRSGRAEGLEECSEWPWPLVE
jgi:hypothetical protein